MRNFVVSAVLAGAVGAIGSLAMPANAADPVAFKEIAWADLVPKDWSPLQRFRNGQFGSLSDSDPRAIQMMREMREAWDNAPTNPAMDGAAVKLPGYVVPLDETKAGMNEFLLVPYFGACIHTPPPPANQIVHVIAARPAKGLRMMDAVWVRGSLKAIRDDSAMGTSGYQMQAEAIDPYVPSKKP
jgi:uncharacterized protein